MEKHELQMLIGSYWNWQMARTQIAEAAASNWWEITTPFLDRHNDFIQVYVREKDGQYILTDDGFTMNDLDMIGIKQDASIEKTARNFGVEIRGGEITARAFKDDFPRKMLRLIQTILAANSKV